MICGNAFFVKHPRTIEDLCQPHRLEEERPYIVDKVICLAKIDYDNFASDMVADRQFLEDNALSGGDNSNAIHCLLIKHRKRNDGILVVSKGAWVAYAALYSPDTSI